jgi:hypothetical protein
VSALDLVVRPTGSDGPIAAPDGPDHVYRFVESVDRFLAVSARATERRNGIPERPRAQTKLHTAAGKQSETGGGLGEHGGWTQRQVRHRRHERHVFGASGEERQQGPRVIERGLVGMVLDGDVVKARCVDLLGQPKRIVRVFPHRVDVRAEQHRQRHVKPPVPRPTRYAGQRGTSAATLKNWA